MCGCKDFKFRVVEFNGTTCEVMVFSSNSLTECDEYVSLAYEDLEEVDKFGVSIKDRDGNKYYQTY